MSFAAANQGLISQIQSIAAVKSGCGIREGRRPSSFSLTCAASNSQRKNPDFSRQNKGFSRGRNRQTSENVEDAGSDILTSKNGPLLSLSSNTANNPRHQATATPGQREKEIVELFRKVQAQLRERAAAKEEKKAETPAQSQGGERGTVDSLLKLLRKHSVDQGKKAKERSSPVNDDQGQSFFESSSMGDVEEPQPVARRPPSNFQRRSPVPRVKYQPVVYPADEEMEKNKSKEVSELEEDEEPITLDDREEEEEEEDLEEEEAEKSLELSSLKLSELRAMAKSKGLKGYSKLKKSEIVELLTGEGNP